MLAGHSIITFMSSALSSFELNTQYTAFLRKLGTELRLDNTELAGIREVRSPNIWAEWGVSVLSGDESANTASKNEAVMRIPRHALPLLMGEAIINGEQVFDFRAGQLAQKVDVMYASQNPAVRQRFERLSAVVANWTFLIGGAIGIKSREWQRLVPLIPQTYITPDKKSGGLAVKFPDEIQTVIPIDGPVETLISIGPGLTGASFVSALSGYAKKVHLISGGKSAYFVNQWIRNTLGAVRSGVLDARRQYSSGAKLPSGMAIKDFIVPEAVFYTDGIAPAMGRLATRATIDIVVMSSVHSAGAEQCRAGVESSRHLLRPGGLLVIKAPDVSLEGEGGLDMVGSRAQELFGKPAVAGPCGMLRQYTDPHLSRDRTASFAVYRQPA